MTKLERGRVNSSRRTVGYTTDTFEDGNAVRRIAVEPQQIPETEPARLKPQVSRQTRKNRVRATQMGKGYVLFLAVVCAAIVGMCVVYLQMQTTITTQTKDIASKERELSDLKADNDAYYNTTIASVDMEAIKDAALNRLGMKYADESQIIYYDTSGSSYVRQYKDVPDAK
ncbi:MAG: hypothetical protein ACI4EG_05090 [Fusicatenibacter sp.]|nr:hypothetical protein [Fusicatenibacter sp.]